MKNKIKRLHIDARKTKNKPAQEAYEAVLTAIQAKEIELRRELIESEIIAICQKVIKQLRETLEYALTAIDMEKIGFLNENINTITNLLPQTYTDTQVINLINYVSSVNGIAVIQKNMGTIIKLTVVASQGRTDSATVARLVKEML